MVVKYAKCSYCGKLYIVGTTHYHFTTVSGGNRGGPVEGGNERPIHC